MPDKGKRSYSMKIIKIILYGPNHNMCTFKKLINFTGVGNRCLKTYEAKPKEPNSLKEEQSRKTTLTNFKLTTKLQ